MILERLLDVAVTVEPMWGVLRPVVAAITDYAVEIRYPGRTATTAETQTLLRETRLLRVLIRHRALRV